MNHKRHNRLSYRQSIYILPNLLTTTSLLFGFLSITHSIGGRFSLAAWAILISGVFDALDGTVARLTNSTSKFGVEYDSLCDLVAFGVAPSILAYLWALTPENLQFLSPYNVRAGSLAAFVFLACGALRLARFNVFSGVRDPGFFQGLPIPGGAVMISAAVLWHYRGGEPTGPNGAFMLIYVVCLAFLMVSNLDYASHKNKALFKNNRPFLTLVGAVMFLTFLMFHIQSFLMPVGCLYLISGPVASYVRSKRKQQHKHLESQAPPQPADETHSASDSPQGQ